MELSIAIAAIGFAGIVAYRANYLSRMHCIGAGAAGRAGAAGIPGRAGAAGAAGTPGTGPGTGWQTAMKGRQ